MAVMAMILAVSLILSGCTNMPANSTPPDLSSSVSIPISVPEQEQIIQTGWVSEQILTGADGEIHYSYYLPEGYDESNQYPMVVAMPGYDKMWFGEETSGRNLDWNGAQVWTEQEEDIIVVTAQLTDWGETSAVQSIVLTEYFLQNFSVDKSRVYATGYSAGGETMSQAVSMRPDLYAAYLHGASQWDGSYAPIAEHDEYCGSQKARDAYTALQEVYRAEGWTAAQIDDVLQLEIPPDAYFNALDIYNYHGGGNVMFTDEKIISWMLDKQKLN